MKKEHHDNTKQPKHTKSVHEEFSYLFEEGEEKTTEVLKKAKKLLHATEQKAKEYLNGWQRERADFANYKKDIQKYMSETSERVREEVLLETITLVDNLELMMQHAHEAIVKSDWFKGVEHTHKQALQALKRHGVTVIEVAKGDRFDPTLHEAVEGEGTVIAEVIQKGYKIGDRVVRPAKVKVTHSEK